MAFKEILKVKNDESKRNERNPNDDVEYDEVIEDMLLTPTNDEPTTIHPFQYDTIQMNDLNRTNEAIHLTYSPAVGVMAPPTLSHKTSSSVMLSDRTALFTETHVRVVIHNITQISEDDIQNGAVTSIYDDEINAKM